MTTPSIAPSTPSDLGHHLKKISHQSAVFFAGTMFTTAAGYFFKIYLARVLGAEGLGIYALGMTVVGLAGTIAAMGLPQTANRFVAVYFAMRESRKLSRFLWSAIIVLIGANLMAGAALIVIRSWVAKTIYHTPALATYMHFFVYIMITGALTTFLGQALAGYKDVARRTVITNFLGQTLTIALTVLLLTLGFGLRGYLAAQVISALAVLCLLARVTWQLTPTDARTPSIGSLETEVISFSMVLFGVQGLEYVATQADRVLLGIYLNAREVGIYSIATALVAFVAVFLQSINQIFAPTVAELYAGGQRKLLLSLYQTLTKWTLGLTIPLAFVMMVFSRPLMQIFGRDFAAGWPVLVVATFGQLVNCGVGSVGQLLLMSGHQQRMLRAQVFAVPAGFALNILLIPRIGLIGAAIAATVTNALLNLLWLRDVRQKLSLSPGRRGYLSLLFPAAATLVAVFVARSMLSKVQYDFVIVLAGVAIAYLSFFIAALVSGLDADDRIFARQAWRQIRSHVTAGSA